MASSLRVLLGRIIRNGRLEVIGADGRKQAFGDGKGNTVRIRFTDATAEDELYRDPQLKLGEIYMDGRLIVEEGDIYDLLALIKSNTLAEDLSFGMIWRGLLRTALRNLRSLLPVNRNKRNISHHYDLSAKLYDLFLDEDWQYSCAYFNPPGISLEEAQLAKKRHIAAKLLTQPGQKTLEIGSGWGGMAMYLAECCNVDVTGITLSEEQLRISRARADRRGLARSVRFELQDYYYLPDDRSYDRIVSIGMFEHVGLKNFQRFFDKVNDVLADDGVMLLHAIGQPYPARINNPWIDKYIFPGGYIPSIAEVMPKIEKAGLLVSDIEILPMHYAHTLRKWRERFMACKEEAIALYDERFVRMWEFYLAGSEMAFTHEKFFIWQMQIVKQRNAVPNNRDYIYKREAELKVVEQRRSPLDKIAV